MPSEDEILERIEAEWVAEVAFRLCFAQAWLFEAQASEAPQINREAAVLAESLVGDDSPVVGRI